MAVDINSLPTVVESVEQVDWDNYIDPMEFSPPIREGNNQLFRMVKCEVSKYDEVTKIVTFNADHDAFDEMGNVIGSVRFDNFSTQTFDRQGVKASSAADQLRALGSKERPQSPAEWGNLMLSYVGQPWRGDHHWEAYCGHKDTEFACKMEGRGKARKNVNPLPSKTERTLKYMKNFPLNGANGSAEYSPTAVCPDCGKEMQARTKIGRRIIPTN